MKYRMTGISTPYGGISWDKYTTAQDRFKYLFIYLESKRVLTNPIEMELKRQCIESVLEIRSTLTEITKDCDFNEKDIATVRKMIDTCNTFLDNTNDEIIPNFISKDGERWADKKYDIAMKSLENL